MKRNLLVAVAVLSWFFAFKFSDPKIPGVSLVTIVQGFKDRASCEQERAAAEDSLTEAGLPDLQFAPRCLERQSA